MLPSFGCPLRADHSRPLAVLAQSPGCDGRVVSFREAVASASTAREEGMPVGGGEPAQDAVLVRRNLGLHRRPQSLACRGD